MLHPLWKGSFELSPDNVCICKESSKPRSSPKWNAGAHQCILTSQEALPQPYHLHLCTACSAPGADTTFHIFPCRKLFCMESLNHSGWKRPLRFMKSNPALPCSPSNHVPRGHIHTRFEHFQGRLIPFFPGHGRRVPASTPLTGTGVRSSVLGPGLYKQGDVAASDVFVTLNVIPPSSSRTATASAEPPHPQETSLPGSPAAQGFFPADLQNFGSSKGVKPCTST